MKKHVIVNAHCSTKNGFGPSFAKHSLCNKHFRGDVTLDFNCSYEEKFAYMISSYGVAQYNHGLMSCNNLPLWKSPNELGRFFYIVLMS